MTSTPQEQQDPKPTPKPDDADVRWWVAAITFVGGILVGVVTTALLIGTTPDFGSAAADSAGTPVPGERPSDAGTVPVTAEARVNAACLRVINEAQDVSRILSGVDDAASDVDLQRLDDIVRRLQPIDARMQRDLRACRVETDLRGGSGASPASPIPTVPQPSGSATR